MKWLARPSLLVVVLHLALIGTASAECAWVLWTSVNALEWESRGEFNTREEWIRSFADDALAAALTEAAAAYRKSISATAVA